MGISSKVRSRSQSESASISGSSIDIEFPAPISCSYVMIYSLNRTLIKGHSMTSISILKETVISGFPE